LGLHVKDEGFFYEERHQVVGREKVIKKVTMRRSKRTAAMVCCAVLLCWVPNVFGQSFGERLPSSATLRVPGSNDQPTDFASTTEPESHVQQFLPSRSQVAVRQRHSQLMLTRSNVRRLSVTDSTICDYVQYSPTELAIIGLQPGATDLMIWFEGEQLPAIYEVNVVHDNPLEKQRLTALASLERHLTELFPRSQVSLISVGSQVLLKGQVYDSAEATRIQKIVHAVTTGTLHSGQEPDRSGVNLASAVSASGQHNGVNASRGVINLLKVPGEQNVKMSVVIAEVSRSQLRQLGKDWQCDSRGGSGHENAVCQTPLSGIVQSQHACSVMRKLSERGTATLLSEPTIVCMSGRSASLMAGGEFAVPSSDADDGNGANGFRGVGTSMVVTPTIIDRDLIRLQIEPEFSAMNESMTVHGVPGTTVKRIQTTVELREGQTLALGGLVSRKTGAKVARSPWISRLPFIGQKLVQTGRATEEEVELLILVTPEIVRPMEPDEVPPLPNFYMTHPTDNDLFAYGQTEGSPDMNNYSVLPYDGTEAGQGSPSAGHCFAVPGSQARSFSHGMPQADGPNFQVPSFDSTPPAMIHPPASSLPPLENQPPTMLSPRPDYSLPPASDSNPTVAPSPWSLLPSQALEIPNESGDEASSSSMAPGRATRFLSAMSRLRSPQTRTQQNPATTYGSGASAVLPSHVPAQDAAWSQRR